jgi:hypothetical protein
MERIAMSSLLEKLAERQKTASMEKTAEQIFIDSFSDELIKLGFDEELIKSAGFMDFAKRIGGKITGLFKSAPKFSKTLGAQVVPLAKKPAQRLKSKLPIPASTGEFHPWGSEAAKFHSKIQRRGLA